MPKPPRLYKYARSEHAEAMLRDGIFRIGTLYDFRRVEAYDAAIGDATEGSLNVVEKIEFAEGPAEIKSFPLASKLISVSSDSDVRLSDVTIFNAINSEDYFIYCTTLRPSPEGMLEFGCDTCIEITDPDGFFAALTETMEKLGLVRHIAVGRCVYGDRERRSTDPDLHPALAKPPEYSYQEEVRAIWEPSKRPLSPVMLQCPEAARYVALYDVGTLDPRNIRRPHALGLTDDDLISKSYLLGERLIEISCEERARASEAYSRFPSAQDHDELVRNYRERSQKLNACWKPIRADIAILVREYSRRGIRNFRLDFGLQGNQTERGLLDMASSLQRAAELLEASLAGRIGRLMRAEQESEYRFWHDGALGTVFQSGARTLTEFFETALIRARRDELEIPLVPDENFQSVMRHDHEVLVLGAEGREAMSWLSKQHGAPAVDVLHALIPPRIRRPRSDTPT